jgi:hypothetical protein
MMVVLLAILVIFGVGSVIFLILLSYYITHKSHGRIVVGINEETGVKTFVLELDRTPEEIEQMAFITFRVTHGPTEDVE